MVVINERLNLFLCHEAVGSDHRDDLLDGHGLSLVLDELLELGVVVMVRCLRQDVHEGDGKEDATTEAIRDAEDLLIFVAALDFHRCQARAHGDGRADDDEDPF